MIDLKLVRQDVPGYKKVLELKNKDIDIDHVLSLDDSRKLIGHERDMLISEQKQAGKEKDFEKAKSLKGKIQELEEKHKAIREELIPLHRSLPNFIHPDVPVGKDEDENVVVYQGGEIPTFDFEPLDHQELGEKLGMIDKKQGVEVAGSRFFYLTGAIAELQYAIFDYTKKLITNTDEIAKIIKEKKLPIKADAFTFVIPPVMIKYEVADKMGRLHPMDDRYCLDKDELMLIGSAEHSLGPLHMGQTFKEEELPKRYFAFTPAFRREAGTYGKDTRGIFRNHQFHKIEMETFSTPETSEAEQDLIVAIQEKLVADLGLPYELMYICTGDMGGIDYRQFDINTWMPGQNTYRETHTSDLMTDYQSRRLNIKVQTQEGKKFVHMNDATAFAMERIIIAIMENNQQADGSIKIPEVLVEYMGKKVIVD